MYNPSIQKQLIESRIRELKIAASPSARLPLTPARPRRWRTRVQGLSLVRRLAI
jgi:hypothetical protein